MKCVICFESADNLVSNLFIPDASEQKSVDRWKFSDTNVLTPKLPRKRKRLRNIAPDLDDNDEQFFNREDIKRATQSFRMIKRHSTIAHGLSGTSITSKQISAVHQTANNTNSGYHNRDGIDENKLNMLNRIKSERQIIKRDQYLMRTFPTAPSRVNVSLRKDVKWAYDSQYYALRVSLDTAFKIRQAPAPELGSPWPMPQLYNPSNKTFIINPFIFKFHSFGEPCDLLNYSFKRIKRNIFGDIDSVNYRWSNEKSKHMVEITSLNVTVLRECADFPFLEMDESCM